MKATTINLLVCISVATACTPDTDNRGCTDPRADNFNAAAIYDDGSCNFSQSTELIWSNGLQWGWGGNLTAGGFVLDVCEGRVEIIEPDTADRNAADTVAFLRVFADEVTGNARFHFRVANPVSAQAYRAGHVAFDARYPFTTPLPEYHSYINGRVYDSGADCPGFNRSDFQAFAINGLTDTVFTQVQLPLLNYPKVQLNQVEEVFGMVITGGQPDEHLIDLNNLRWENLEL